MPKISVKEFLDFDLIAGMIVAFIYDYIWVHYIQSYIPFHFNLYGIDEKDFLVLFTLVVFAWFTKGRIRKILVYAFFFDLYLQLLAFYWKGV